MGGRGAVSGAKKGKATMSLQDKVADIAKQNGYEGNFNVYKTSQGTIFLMEQSDNTFERTGHERIGAYNAIKDKNGKLQVTEIKPGIVSDNVVSDRSSASSDIINGGGKAKLEMAARRQSIDGQRAFATYSSVDPQAKSVNSKYYTVASRYDNGNQIRSKSFTGKTVSESNAKADAWIKEQKKTAIVEPKSKKKK